MIRTVNLQTFTPSELTSCLFKYIFKISLFISNCGKIHIKFTILAILKWGRFKFIGVQYVHSCAANLQNSLHRAELRLFTHRCILSSHSPWQHHSTFCLYEFVYSECLIEDTVLSLCDWFISLSMMSS